MTFVSFVWLLQRHLPMLRLLISCTMLLPSTLLGQWPVANLAADQLLGGWDAAGKRWLTAAEMKARMTQPQAYRIYSFGAWLGQAQGAAPLQIEKATPCEVDRLKIATGFKRGLAVGSAHQAAPDVVEFVQTLPPALQQQLDAYCADSLRMIDRWQEASYAVVRHRGAEFFYVQLGYFGMPREGEQPVHNASVVLAIHAVGGAFRIHPVAVFNHHHQPLGAALQPGAHVYAMQHILDLNADGQPEIVVADAGTQGPSLWAYSWDGLRYMPVVGYNCQQAHPPHNE